MKLARLFIIFPKQQQQQQQQQLQTHNTLQTQVTTDYNTASTS
jgi:hypothetical protein